MCHERRRGFSLCLQGRIDRPALLIVWSDRRFVQACSLTEERGGSYNPPAG